MIDCRLIFLLTFFSFVRLSAQNVGIGTSNPNGELHIHSTASDKSVIQRLTTVDAEVIVGFNPSNEGILGTVTNHDLRIRTNNTNRFVVDKKGNIGIGTSFPVTKMQMVNGSFLLSGLGTSNNLGLQFGESGSPTFGWIYDGEGSSADNQLHLREYIGTESDLITFKGDGRIGIGTEDPSQKLQVSNGSLFLSNLGSTKTKGILLGEFSTPSYGWIFDGEGNGEDNKLILREYLGFQSDVLEVNGNGELKLNKLSSTTKRQLYVDDDGTISDGPTYSYYSAVNIDVFESFKHNITLPDGARIISIEVKYLDRSSSRQIAFFLTRRGFSNTVISDLTSFSSGNSFSNTQTQFETKQITGSQAIVNNETYAYTLTGSVNNSSSDQFALRITSYRIKYSFD